MSRILSQTMIRGSQTLMREPPPSAARSRLLRSPSRLLRPSSRLVTFRGCAHRPEKALGQLVEVDLEAEASASGVDVEVLGMRKLEDAIYSIIVHRSAPGWLPFSPGSSYWVPPMQKRVLSVVDLLGRLANPLTEDQVLSLTTVRGWPSSAYFVKGETAVDSENAATSGSDAEE